MNSPKTCKEPVITPERAEPFIGELTKVGGDMVATVSGLINRITCMRAMQVGYLMACQDHGLKAPEFTDPANELGVGILSR